MPQDFIGLHNSDEDLRQLPREEVPSMPSYKIEEYFSSYYKLKYFASFKRIQDNLKGKVFILDTLIFFAIASAAIKLAV